MRFCLKTKSLWKGPASHINSVNEFGIPFSLEKVSVSLETRLSKLVMWLSKQYNSNNEFGRLSKLNILLSLQSNSVNELGRLSKLDILLPLQSNLVNEFGRLSKLVIWL